MLKRTSQFVGYLLISLFVGTLLTFATSQLGNIVEEDEVVHNLRTEVENTFSYLRKSFPDMSAEQTVDSLEQFISSVMKARLVAVSPSLGKKPNREDFRYLMSFTRGNKSIDIYVRNAYVKGEADGLDADDVVGGLCATVVVFTVLVVYAEKRRQTLVLQQEIRQLQE